MTPHCQPAVLALPPAFGRFLTFDLAPGADPRATLRGLATHASPSSVLGFGLPLVLSLGANLPGLRAFPALAGPGVAMPSTQGAVWAFVGGDDASSVHDRACALVTGAAPAFALREEVATFKYREGRDLTGYEDGTENPAGERAVEAAVVSGAGAGLDGSTFAAGQKYVHDLERFAAQPAPARDLVVGRRIATNEEIADAPASAHVKRTAQESFDPPAFMVRRSMPWGGTRERGLYFVAYGRSLDAYERALRRMMGMEDGIVDRLLSFTRAVSGGYYWCPPTTGDALDLSALAV
jgi:putative iron-dependent peroxidase